MSFLKNFAAWVNGDEREQWFSESAPKPAAVEKKKPRFNYHDMSKAKKDQIFKILYRITGTISILFLLAMLLTVMVNLPICGEPGNPTNNELSQYYIEHGLEDAGATNLVGNMILNYRVFDTFGESSVLFLAATSVTMLLARDSRNTREKLRRYFAHEDEAEEIINDRLLRTTSRFILPVIMLYSLYIMFNGHLSPGGGFAGGSILGGGLILFAQEFGSEGVHRFFDDHMYHIVKVSALAVYGLLLIYNVFTGVNGLLNIIPLGTPGSIFSSGIILPINVGVGFEVTCTIYAFYGLFHKGEI